MEPFRVMPYCHGPGEEGVSLHPYDPTRPQRHQRAAVRSDCCWQDGLLPSRSYHLLAKELEQADSQHVRVIRVALCRDGDFHARGDILVALLVARGGDYNWS